MPPAIAAVAGPVALAAFNAGLPLFVANAIVGVGIGGTLLYGGGAIALSIGASILLRPPLPKPSDGQTEMKQAVPPRMWHYGRVKVSGPVAFYETSGGTLYKAVLISAREVDAIEMIYLDEVAVELSGTTVTNAFLDDGEERAFVASHLGTDDQTTDADLLSVFDPDWTANHRLRGIAYIVAWFSTPTDGSDMAETFPNGEPQVKALIRGAKLYDPRLDSTVTGGSGAHRHDDPDTWAWSDNAALAILDYLTHVDGYNRPISEFDLPSFQDMADLCDEDVDLAASGTENRYRIATTVFLTEKRTDVLKRLLEACDAEIYPTAAGTWAIRGGAYVAPTVTLDADQGHIIEAQFTAGKGALDRYNELAIQYMSPDHGYGEVEGDPWQNESDPDFIDGLVEVRPLDLLQIPSHGQARRLAKLHMARDNPEWIGEITTNFYGLDCIGERLVTIKWPELLIDGPFWIDALSVKGDGTGATLSVRSADPTAYDWDEDTEEGSAPPVPPDISGLGGGVG